MKKLSIEQIHREKTGKVSDKWASYLPFYDEIFEKYCTQNLSLLEIGIQNASMLFTNKRVYDSETIVNYAAFSLG